MRSDRGSMPTAAIIVVALVITAVVGVIAGAVWGQSGHSTPDSSPTTAAPTSDSASPTQSDTATPTDTGSVGPTDTGTPTTSPTGSTSPTTGPGPTPTGSAPPAPATTTTVADGWRLGPWRITQTGGNLGVDTTCRNTATGTRSANLVLYVYVNGQLIATTTATVTNVAAGATVPVHFSSTDAWKPGSKVLLLQTA
jgi:hypothetical protein